MVSHDLLMEELRSIPSRKTNNSSIFRRHVVAPPWKARDASRWLFPEESTRLRADRIFLCTYTPWWGKREGPRGIDIFEETRDQFPTTVQLVNAKIPIHWVTYSWQSHPYADAVCPPTAPLPLRDTRHVKSSERRHRRLGPHLSIKILTEGKARQVNFPWVVNPTPLPPQELKFDRHNNPGNRDNWNFKGKTLGTKVGFQTLSQFHFFSVIVQCSCPIRSVMDNKISFPNEDWFFKECGLLFNHWNCLSGPVIIDSLLIYYPCSLFR